MRLRIWRGLSPLADVAGADGGRLDGDIASFYRDEAPRLRRRLARRFGSDSASDFVQLAFVRLLGMGDERLVQVEHPRALVERIADNAAINEAKTARRRFEHFEYDPDDAALPVCDPRPGLEARDMLRRIEQAIPALPERTRDVFMAHRFEDLSYSEIAARMGISIKTVEKHISIALRELHRALGQSRDR